MNEELIQQLIASAEGLKSATEILNQVLEHLTQQHAALESKVDRIVAAIDEQTAIKGDSLAEREELARKIVQLESANQELRVQASRGFRKTLPALATAVLSKSGIEDLEQFDTAALDKAMSSLSVEQRIAVKAEMARAGLID